MRILVNLVRTVAIMSVVLTSPAWAVPMNLAPLGLASQSSTAFGGAATRGNDGNTDGSYFTGSSVTHTGNAQSSFWEVSLTGDFAIDQIILFNRSDCCGNRLSQFRVTLFDDTSDAHGSPISKCSSENCSKKG